jgi:hypothetical protein
VCDDVAFESEREAKMFSETLRQRLAKFGLRIADDKSRIVEFGRYAKEGINRYMNFYNQERGRTSHWTIKHQLRYILFTTTNMIRHHGILNKAISCPNNGVHQLGKIY